MNTENLTNKRQKIKARMYKQISAVQNMVGKDNYEMDNDMHYGVGFYINGIKLEWNITGGHIKMGYGCSTMDHVKIAEYLSNHLKTEVYRSNKGALPIVFPDPDLNEFKLVYDLLKKHNLELEKPQRNKRGAVRFSKENPFQKAAELVKMAVDNKLKLGICRASGVFDLEEFIVGESTNRTEKNSRKEHVVPCDFMVHEAVEMYRAGCSLSHIAEMFRKNCIIVLISNEQARYLDQELAVKTTMPKGWKLGDDPFARLHLADINYNIYRESNKLKKTNTINEKQWQIHAN